MQLKDWLSAFFSLWACTVSTIALIVNIKNKDKKKNRDRKRRKPKRKR